MAGAKMKPLHVLVAEALGQQLYHSDRWYGGPPDYGWHGRLLTDSHEPIPRYDTDWSATGPLIERLNLTVGRFARWFNDGKCYAILPGDSAHGHDYKGAEARAEGHGDTRLLAVCNVILALHEAGRLKELLV